MLPLRDADALALLSEQIDDEEALRAVLDSFTASIGEFVARTEAGLAEGDLAQVLYAAHTLKSSAGMLGALRLTEACERVEGLARAGDAGALREAVPAFAAVAAETERVFRQHADPA